MYQIGDIICYEAAPGDVLMAGIQALQGGNPCVHVAIISSEDCNLMIDAALMTGVSERPVSFENATCVLRLKNIDRYSADMLVRACSEEIGCQYDLTSFPETFLRAVVLRCIPAISGQRSATNDPKRWFCSELMAKKIFDCFNLYVSESVDPESTVPGMFPASEIFEVTRVF